MIRNSNSTAVIKPHTIARWTVSILSKAEVDTNIFKAYSTRGASATAAANEVLQWQIS